MKGSRKVLPAILLVILTLLLVACGDATATTGPAAQPTITVPTATAPVSTAPVTSTTKPVTTTIPATTAPGTTKPVTTTAVTTAPNTTKPATTAPVTTKPVATTAPATTQPYPSANTDATSVPISEGQSFQLRMLQNAFLPASNLYVSFAGISEDSRCPEANTTTGQSVECYWAGQVTAEILVSANNGRTRQTVKLTLPGSVNTKTTSKATIENYQLEVKEILPHKVMDVDIGPGEYVITLVVSK